ncbi:hypothetical protein BD769DRAFT_1355382 [Suillus cothurnatus]|nr:hypothetical protein BD769DRAFT_1355382 [Suillus cothurnatus]
MGDSSKQTTQAAARFTPYPAPSRPRRPSSCPPVGAEPVNPSTDLDSWAPFLITHDDLARRPSRTTMYHSVTSEPIASPLIPACDLPNSQPDEYAWFGAPVPYAWPLPDREDDPLFETQVPDATSQLNSPFGQQVSIFIDFRTAYKCFGRTPNFTLSIPSLYIPHLRTFPK